MDSIKAFIQQSIKDNRMKILGFSVIISMLSSAITLGFNSINLWYVGIVMSTLLVVLYFVKINELTQVVTSGNNIALSDLVKVPTFNSKILKVFLLFIGIALIAFLLTNLLMLIPFGGIIVLLLIVLIVTISTALIAIVLENDRPIKESLGSSLKTVIAHKDILLHYASKVVKAAFIGAMIILAVNVFVYAPQLQLTLENSAATNEEIISYFITPLANFIQITGSQTIVFYIIFVGFVSYKTLNKQLQFRSKKGKKNR